MNRTIVIFGALSGAVTIGGMITSYALAGGEGVFASVWVGYLIMLLALSLIFLGIKRYRDELPEGVITFGRAFGVGFGISVIASLVYVAAWELYLAMTDYAFIDEYTAGIVEAKRSAGVSGAELEAAIDSMERLKVQYANPLFRIPMTLTEILPVALLVTLISAAVLRNPRVLPARR